MLTICKEFLLWKKKNLNLSIRQRYTHHVLGVRAEIQAARLLVNNAKKGNNWEAAKIYQISVLNFHYEKDDNPDGYPHKDSLPSLGHEAFMDLINRSTEFAYTITLLVGLDIVFALLCGLVIYFLHSSILSFFML